MAAENVWLADFAQERRDAIVADWIARVHGLGDSHYSRLSTEELTARFTSLYHQMIHTFRTGDLSSAKEQMCRVIEARFESGFTLLEIEQALLALGEAVHEAVDRSEADTDTKLSALRSIGSAQDRMSLYIAQTYQQLQSDRQQAYHEVYEFGTVLDRSLDIDAVLDAAVEGVRKVAHVQSLCIMLRTDGKPPEVRRAWQVSQDLAHAMPEICRHLGCEPKDCAVGTARELVCTAPDLRSSGLPAGLLDLLISNNLQSLACIPLLSGTSFIGGQVVFHSRPHEYTGFEIDILLALGIHIGVTVRNAQLYEEAKGKREMSLLLEAGRLFASDLDLGEVLKRVAQMAVEIVDADYSGVMLLDDADNRLHIRAYSSRPGKGEEGVRRVSRLWEPEGIKVDEFTPGRVFASGRPLVIDDYPHYPQRLHEMEDITGSLLMVPIARHGRPTGLFVMASEHLAAFSEDDLHLAEGVADQAATAIENARLYERERNIAETLQSSLLPAGIPRIPGFKLCARYQAAMREAEVGGDFYDVFEVEPGRFVALVADVSGKGLNAAIYTALGKHVIRAYAIEDPSPESILRRLNRALCAYMPYGLFITVFCMLLEADGEMLTYASAGHDPPFYYAAAREHVTMLDVTGPGAGTIPHAQYTERRLAMETGDMIFLYTDGATDIRRNGGYLRTEGLKRIVGQNLGRTGCAILDGVFDSILEYGRGQLVDDIVLLHVEKE